MHEQIAKRTDEWFDNPTIEFSRQAWVEKFADIIIEDFLAIAENELHPQAYAQVLTKVQQHFYEKTTF